MSWEPISGKPHPEAEPKRKGNTGVVLVIVGVVGCFGLTAIVGILAAIAIPNFMAMQLRAKRAEAPTNVGGVRTALIAQAAMTEQPFVSLPPCPASPPAAEPVPWEGPCTEVWGELWRPFGDVGCRYEVVATDGGRDFEAIARCDLDGDGQPSVYAATKELSPTMQTPNNVY
jgi:type II secretory pathway pseudopilin PulG